MLCNKLYAYQLGQLCRGTARDRLIAQGKDGAKIFPLSLVGVLSPTRRARDLSLVGVLSPTRRARDLSLVGVLSPTRRARDLSLVGVLSPTRRARDLSLVGVLSPTRRARDLSLVGVLSPTRRARDLASAQLSACCRSYHRTTVLGLTLDSVLRFAGGLEAILVTHFLSHFCLVSVTSMLATTGLWWCYLHALRRGLIDVCEGSSTFAKRCTKTSPSSCISGTCSRTAWSRVLFGLHTVII